MQQPPTSESDKTDWEWNHTSYGYDGVCIEGQNLIWYRQEHNTLAGSAARMQSTTDFLANGPALPVPAEVLPELVSVVAKLNAL